LIVGIEAFTFQMVTLLEPSRRRIQKEPVGGAITPPEAPFHSSNVQACHRERAPTTVAPIRADHGMVNRPGGSHIGLAEPAGYR
jgi:hypothetical protein